MFESDARRTHVAPQPLASVSGFEDEEPPSRPRRHPVWENVPDAQWDDWRWQTQNSIRSVRQLRTLLRFSPDELEAIGRLEGDYKLAIPPYYFSLIDPRQPRRSRSACSPCPRRWKPRTPPGTNSTTRWKKTRTRRSPG